MKQMPNWSKEELEILRNEYPLGNKNNMCQALPLRSWSRIQQKAAELKIRLKYNPRRKHNVKNLLQDTHKAYYWMGFIAADGNFSSSKWKRLSVTLSIMDLSHLEKLAKYIETDYFIGKNGEICSVSATGTDAIELIMNKFDLRPRKTYNPPKTISWMRPDLALSFLIGFIDGDGCIKKGNNPIICIKVHSSWLNIFKEFNKLLIESFGIANTTPYIGKTEGFSLLNICKFELIKKLKLHAINHSLPILVRKWDRIDLNKISLLEIASHKKDEVIRLYKQGFSVIEISPKVNLTIQRIYTILKKERVRQSNPTLL